MKGLNPAVIIATQIIKNFSNSEAYFVHFIDALIVAIGSAVGGILAGIFFSRFYH